MKLAVVAACAAAGAVVAGCAARCPPMTCPTNSVDWHALGDSTVTWTFPGAAPRTATGFVPAPAGASTCSLRMLRTLIFPTSGGGETLQDGYVRLDCGGGSGDKLTISINHIGDVRDWSVGTLTPASSGLFAEYLPAGATGPAALPQCDVPDLDSVPVTITVEDASGGRAPLPKMVTDDFVRTFWFDVDTSGVMVTDYNGSPCDFPVAVRMSMHLTQTAADYVHDPNTLCGCG